MFSSKSNYLNNSQQAHFALLAIIIIFGAAMRLYGIDFGLPELLHRDESFEMHRALRLTSGSFDFRRAGKGGLYFLIFGEQVVTFVFLFVIGKISSSSDFAYFFIQHESSFYWGARIISASLGIVSIYLVYRIISKLYSHQAGIIAMLFLSISNLHVHNSHYATVDVPLVFLLLLTWYFIIQSGVKLSVKNIIICGILGGLAFATKLSAAPIILPMIACIFIYGRQQQYSVNKIIRLQSIIIITFVISAIIFEPGYIKSLIHFDSLINRIFGPPSPTSITGHQPKPEIVFHGVNLFVVYGKILLNDLGLPLLVAFLLSTVIAICTFPVATSLFLLFLIPYFIAICSATTDLFYGRYLLPLIPLISCITAIGLTATYEYLQKTFPSVRKSLFIIFCVVITFLSWHSLSITYTNVQKMAKEYPQISAKKWIEAHIPQGASIHMEGNIEHRSQYDVPLLNISSNIDRLITELKEKNSGKARYWELRRDYINTLIRPRYNLSFTDWHEQYPSLNELQKLGVNYLLVNTDRMSGIKSCKISKISNLSRINFYRDLVNKSAAVKIAEFTNFETYGPNLSIYELMPTY